MMKTQSTHTRIVELDGSLHQVSGDTLLPVDDLRSLSGDIWLATDFQEAMSRVMTVEGPGKYAEMLVRRKLQEAGEFEEAVEIFTHWKQKRGKNATEIFFTAVPSRLSRFYLEELPAQAGISLVFSMYGVLWDVIKRTRSKAPMAVVLRHDRFAEVLVASRERVYFANRCVAFDTENEQLDALWTTIQADIEAVEEEHHVQVSRIMRLDWLDTLESPNWPEEWQNRLFQISPEVLQHDGASHAVTWPQVLKEPSALQSESYWQEKLLHYAQKWAPLVNGGMALAAILLLVTMAGYRWSAGQLQRQADQVKARIGQIHLSLPQESMDPQFDGLLEFVGKLDRHYSAPSYQQIIEDLTLSPFKTLALNRLKVEFNADRIRMELYGDIEAPFDRAHAGYQGYLKRLNARGYVVEESRFETEISKSQIMLKLTRPLI